MTSHASFVEKWSTCHICSIGVQAQTREVLNAERQREAPQPLLGAGQPGGLFFVGDPVDEPEENLRDVFASSHYKILHQSMGVLAKAGEEIPYYLTHSLACRPCVPALLPDGTPIRDRYQLPIYRSVHIPPTDALKACRTRLHQEIYAVDPVLVVALGSRALQALKSGADTALRGSLVPLDVEGETPVPHLTPKGVWGRKVRGEMVYPTRPAQVRYPIYVTGDLRSVETYGSAEDPDRERAQFLKDLRSIVKILRTYKEIGEAWTKS